jgi:hypothetical protein
VDLAVFGLALAASGALTGACSTVDAFFASEVCEAFAAGFFVSVAGSFALFGKWKAFLVGSLVRGVLIVFPR